MPPSAGMARIEAKLASVQSEAKEKGKLRNEPLDRSTRLFVGMALQSGDEVRRCVKPETWPASCESCTNKVLDQVVSSVVEPTKKRSISQKMLRVPHFSAPGRATKAPGEIGRPDRVVWRCVASILLP